MQPSQTHKFCIDWAGLKFKILPCIGITDKYQSHSADALCKEDSWLCTDIVLILKINLEHFLIFFCCFDRIHQQKFIQGKVHVSQQIQSTIARELQLQQLEASSHTTSRVKNRNKCKHAQCSASILCSYTVWSQAHKVGIFRVYLPASIKEI